MSKIIIPLCIAAFTLAGCATITRGTTNQVAFQSEPAEADMKTSTGQTCITPCTLAISRKSEFTAVFSKPGYNDFSVAVQTKIAGNGAAGFAGNILVGGVIGMAADAASGATLDHTPNPVVANMTPVTHGATRPHRKSSRRTHRGS